MISKILNTCYKLFNPDNRYPNQIPEVIDLTGAADATSQAGCPAQPGNSRKRKFNESEATNAGLKRRRLAMDNSDDEEDVTILHRPGPSMLQSFWSWVLGPSTKQEVKQKVNQGVQATTKDDLNTKESEILKEVIRSGTFQAAPPSKFLQSVEPEEVQLVKVVNPNKIDTIDLTALQDENDTPTTTVTSSIASSEASVQLDSAKEDSEVECLRRIPGFSRPSQRFRLTTSKERKKQSYDSIPSNLRLNLKSGRKSTMSSMFKKPSYVNFKARDSYQSLIQRSMGRDTNPWTSGFSNQFRNNTSLFQSLSPYNTSVVRQAQNHIINIKDDEDEISVIEPESGASKSTAQTLFKTPFKPFTAPFTSVISPTAPLSGAKDVLVHSTPFVQKSPKSKEKAIPEVITLSRSSSLEEEFKTQDVYSTDYLKKMKEKYSSNTRDRERKINEEKLKTEFLVKKREDTEESLNERILNYMKITEVVLEEPKPEEEEEETELPEITPDMEEVIRRAYRARDSEKLVQAYKIDICGKDVDTLKGLNWLNDEVINFYLQLIVTRGASEDNKYQKVFAFNTFFYSTYKDNGYSRVRRWTKKEDVFSYDLLLIPVHLGMHWCLATIDVKEKSINYYDSMNGNNQTCLDLLKRYLQEEHQDKKKAPMDLTEWKQEIKKDIPQQMNGSDCGMFACKFAEYLSRRARITFTQQDMPYFRKRMVYEIVKTDLMKP
jgi:sentrin-specific protease 1